MSSSARADGRTPGMMRSLTLERSFLSRADGSARWEQGAFWVNSLWPATRCWLMGTFFLFDKTLTPTFS